MIHCLIPDMPSADELNPWLRRIDENKWYTNFGPLAREFESELEALFRRQCGDGIFLTTMASGASALEIAVASLRLPQGRRALLPAFTFPATGTAVVRAGLKPVFADVDPRTWQLTPDIARAALREAPYDLVVPVATFGCPVPTAPWDDFHRDTAVPVVIDAAGAFGDQRIGDHGVLAFSLHATKPLGVGEGGLFVTRDQELCETVRRMSNYGFRQGTIDFPGTNAKLSEYHAAVGLAQIRRWDGIRERRQRMWRSYQSHLAEHSSIVLQEGIGSCGPCFLSVLLPCAAEGAAGRLREEGIEARRWYCPSLVRHPGFSQKIELPLPITERLEQHTLGIPFHTRLDEGQISSVCTFLSDAVREAK